MTPIEILQELGIPFAQPGESRDVREGYVGIRCPYCGRPDDKFYLGWNTSTRRMSCWSCGGLPTVKTLAELAGIPVGRARALLGELEPAEWQTDKATLRGRYIEPPGVGEMRRAHREYLGRRGFNPRAIEKIWGVRGIGPLTKLAWRLFIPHLYRGAAVSWTTRTIGIQEPRYVGAPAEYERISAKEILYGGDYVRSAAVIVEGPVDVWAIGPGAVGLSGIGFSPAQVRALSRIPARYVCFDNEPAAQLRARQLCDQLAPFLGQTHNIVLDSKDPGSATRKEIRTVRKLLD